MLTLVCYNAPMKRFLLWLLIISIIGVGLVQAQDAGGDLLARVNSLRASLGLTAYTWNGSLAAAAANQARWMVDNNQVTHTQFDGSTPRSRAVAAGYGSAFVSENIYVGGLANTDYAWNFWINSPIHYAGLTNAQYNEVGIASADGAGGHSFVMVFGNSSGWQPPANTASGGGGNAVAVAAAPALPIVGVDNSGNLMYEVQDGDDLGTIALLFGYSWDDLPGMMELNHMTQEDIRLLKTGSVFLVPPASGTYTPTPEPTLDPSIPTETPTPTATLTLTPTFTPTLTATPTDLPPAVYVQPSITPTQPMLIRTLAPVVVAMVSTPALQEATTDAPPASGPPAWLLVAIGVQVAILGTALFQFIRRR